ncbi:MAG: YcgN family cysteine cluster protein [Emcibacteraceae bacterium]|nr:YcgN family cysteine cluster protein [Emcibacteraceae bacterium]MDG1996487.1 YcgN family cysteine cluster protein [Emcibacteraceae bacterium]
MSESKTHFWKEKSFDDMSNNEWESLCDGCGLCCLHKLEDANTGDISYTNVACRLLDIGSCRCKKYTKRKKLVPDCVILKPEQVSEFKWLPRTCAYRLISEGKELHDWHPLISGSTLTVHKEGISVSDKAISERDAGDLQDYIIHVDTE